MPAHNRRWNPRYDRINLRADIAGRPRRGNCRQLHRRNGSSRPRIAAPKLSSAGTSGNAAGAWSRAGRLISGSGWPPEIVVVVDADRRLEPGCLDAMAHATETGRPAEPANRRNLPPLRERSTSSGLGGLSKTACGRGRWPASDFLVSITGSGCAFPWAASRCICSTVADRRGHERRSISLGGSPPSDCDDAVLFAALPDRPEFVSERRRRKHGHHRTVASQVPRLAPAFSRTGRFDLADDVHRRCRSAALAVVALYSVGDHRSVAVALGGGWRLPQSVRRPLVCWLDRSEWHGAVGVGPDGVSILPSVPHLCADELPLTHRLSSVARALGSAPPAARQASVRWKASSADAKATEDPIEDVVGVNRPKHASQVL